MIIQRIWGSLGSLYLKRPNILSSWFDAKGYRIANLGKPKRDSDAVDLGTLKDEISGVNSTILKKEKRTLRVDDIDIPALPKVSERRNKQIGFDNSGTPTLLDPAETGALGYILVDSFEKGALITSRYQALHFEYNGEYYRWDGDLPKPVPASSTPQSTGGVGEGAWVSVGDASVRSDMPKILGFVEGWRSQYPDDTDCIDAALSESALIVKLERGRHYYVRGGVFYSRKYQSVNLNGAFIWLKDNAGIYRLTIFEMDDHSQIFNGTIDGNYQNNIHDSANWVTNVDLIPFAQGIFTSRYLTNNNIPKKAIGARVDNVTVRNTIRSNFVLTGKDQLHGNITAQNSYADHLIYFTGSDNVKYEKAYIDGICRGEAISIGTAGSG
ncbi:hypothetical protein M0L63_RS04235, partial [Providencia rettgeri]|nr:hypothetical protein [Providencia rettgeri]